MKITSAVLAGALAFATLAMARTKTYSINVAEPMNVQNVQLAPGDYKVHVEGTNAVFDEANGGKPITLPVKVESTKEKYDSTAIETSKSGSVTNLTGIELGGSRTKLDFNR